MPFPPSFGHTIARFSRRRSKMGRQLEKHDMEHIAMRQMELWNALQLILFIILHVFYENMQKKRRTNLLALNHCCTNNWKRDIQEKAEKIFLKGKNLMACSVALLAITRVQVKIGLNQSKY